MISPAAGSSEVYLGEHTALELGTFARSGDIPATASRLIVATFNIRYAVGPYLISGGVLKRVGIRLNRQRAAAVRANIAASARAFSDGQLLPVPDIIGIQEADRETIRSGGVHVARELSSALAMHYAHAATDLPRHVAEKRKQWYLDFEEHIAQDDTGDTGVALLGRLPFENAERIDLPWRDCPWRPRLAVGASIRFGPARVRVFNSHIDPHAASAQQLAQHEAILERAALHQGPTILMGDFNTLTPKSRKETRALLESHGYTTGPTKYTATWRAGLYTQHADWIFVRGLEILRWGVARPLRVSDHWPFWAEVALPRP